MADSNMSTNDIPDAALKQKKSSAVSAVWLIPLVAVVIGAWMVFQHATDEKAIASITFKSADGIEAGKTAVKLRNLTIGKVINVKVEGLSKVVVTVELDGFEQDALTDATRFWVVRPRVGVGGVSGLDTLLSGAYVEIDPGEGGEETSNFIGLEEPDIYQLGNPGTRYILNVGKLGSLTRGSPVKFRDIEVGQVTSYKLVDDHSHVNVEIFVQAPHDKYVNETTRFWNISGLSLELDAQGIQLKMDSLAALVSGGVAFSTDVDMKSLAQSKENTVFKLHVTEKPDIEEILTFSAPIKLYFEKGISGLSKGAPVEFKGLRIGTVVDIGIDISREKQEVLTYAVVDIEPDRLPGLKGPKLSHKERVKVVYGFFETMVDRGMRAQLKTGNVLTGQSLVVFDVFPTIKKGEVKYVEGMPVLPTAPETVKGILDKVDVIMARLEAMPLEDIGKNIEETTASLNSLIQSLNAVEGGMMGVQIGEAIDELTRAARSLRSMAEYLERHPEALLKGKASE